MNWIGRRGADPFWARLPAELGSLFFRCDLRDGIMREVCLTGRYEPQETALLQRILRPGMTFVDVGANWGYFTLCGAHLVGRTGRVVSIEVDPRACRTLKANVKRNMLESVTVLEVAAATRRGPAATTIRGPRERLRQFWSDRREAIRTHAVTWLHRSTTFSTGRELSRSTC
jgi:tRNA G37 N-methylase Trm5